MMFANSKEQKHGVAVKWGTPFVRDRLHTDYGPRFDEKVHLLAAQKTESEVVPPSRHLWVGNVSQHVSETALAEQFSRFGEVESITVYSSRNYAFINFRKEEDAVIAKRSLQGLILGGLALRIEFAKGAKPSRNLYVAGICQSVTSDELEEEFRKFGALENFRFYPDRNRAVVDYLKTDDAIAAVESLNKKRIGKEELRIDYGMSQLEKQESHLSSVHHAEEYSRFRDDRRSSEVFDFSASRDLRFSGPDSDASFADKTKGDKDAEPSEVLWIGFPVYMKVDELSLRRVFSPFGDIEHITTFPGRTYAFVQFKSVVAACRAKDALQGKLFNNPRVSICFSKSEVGPVEHGRNSVNATLPFSNKAPVHPGLPLKVAENLRHDRNHGMNSGGLSMSSPSFGSNPERLLPESNVNRFGRPSSARTNSAGSSIGGGYDQVRAAMLGSEMSVTKETTEISMNGPGLDKSAFWRTNSLNTSHGGGHCFDDIREPPADDILSREVKRPRVGAIPGKDPSKSPLFDQGKEFQHFGLQRTGSMNSGSEGYKPSRFPIGSDGDVGASHRSTDVVADSALHMTRPSQHADGPWHARDNFESGMASRAPPSLSSVKWDGCALDAHHGPLNDEWKWQGTIAKGGTPVCRARCFPVGKVLDVTLPEFLNCTARTGLDMLAKHFYQAGSVGVVFFVPESDPDIIPYNEFMHYLGEKQRAAVAKLGEGITLFLVPPSEFSEQVLKVPGKVSISGVILKFQQLNPTYGPSHQPPSEPLNAHPQPFLHRASLTNGPHMQEDTYPKSSSPLPQARYSGQSNIGLYSERSQSSGSSFPSLPPFPPAEAGSTSYQRHGSGSSPSSSSFGGTINAAVMTRNLPETVVNENRPCHPSPQNQASGSAWAYLNQDHLHVLNSRGGSFTSQSSSLLSSQSEFASVLPSLGVQQQQQICISETNSGQHFMGIPSNSSIGGPNAQNQQHPPSVQPTSLSIPQLQPDQLAQLASLFVHQQQSAQLSVAQPLQENQQPPLHSNSQSVQNFSSIPQGNSQVQMAASLLASSAQFSYGQQPQTQLQQHTSQPAALPYGGHANDAAMVQSQIGNQPDNQTQNDGKEDTEADPQKRLQATLQLAAALLQQIQQQARTVDQQ